jgi:uncharacterized protein
MRHLLLDSLKNLVTGMGTERDKTTYDSLGRRVLSDELLGILYRHWIFAKAVDIPVDDMTRERRKIWAPSVNDPDAVDKFYREEIRLQVWPKFNEALRWARLYGASMIILDVADRGGDVSKPLDLKSVTVGALKNLLVVDKTEVVPEHNNGFQQVGGTLVDPRLPTGYRLNGDATVIHPSRVIRFDGRKLPWREIQQNNYWGGSVLEPLYDEALNAIRTSSAIGHMVSEANIDVVSVKGLFNDIMTGKGINAISERFRLGSMMKSIHRMVILDGDRETFQRQPLNFGGLSPLVSEFLQAVAAAADIPITRFLGTSAGGLNATGEGDLRNYYDNISAQQETVLAPALRQLDAVLTRHVFGDMPPDWGFEFAPLWTISDLDRATIDKSDSETDEKYLAAGVIQPNHVAARLLNAGRYESMTADYVDSLRDMDEMAVDFSGTPSNEATTETED